MTPHTLAAIRALMAVAHRAIDAADTLTFDDSTIGRDHVARALARIDTLNIDIRRALAAMPEEKT